MFVKTKVKVNLILVNSSSSLAFKSAIIIQIQSHLNMKAFFFLALIDTKLLLSISWKISKISYVRGMSIWFLIAGELKARLNNELAIVGEIILIFSFHKYLVIKSVFQVT